MAIIFEYRRFSSAKQDLGDSMRRQTELGASWIERNNHTRGHLVLDDAGISAFRGKNRHEGALKVFLDAIESGQVKKGSILLVENLDRLSREGIYPALSLFGKILEQGIDIVVLQPYEQHYTKESVNDLVGLMIPLIHFYLAHLESQKKSDRLKSAWDNKRKNAVEGKKFNRRCPSWIIWDEAKEEFVKRDGWEAIPFIFELSAEGYGHPRIIAQLQQKFSPLGHSGSWNTSFINSVLNDRSVLGELQPMATDSDGKRIPSGPAIPDYYPRVIEDNLWYRSQAARATRKKQKGPNSQFLNIFPGLVFCSQDQSKMHVFSSPNSNGGRVRRLVSYKHKMKEGGACSVTMDYDQFEQAVLSYLSEISPSDLIPSVEINSIKDKERERLGLKRHLVQLENTLSDPEFSGVKSLVRTIKEIESKLIELTNEIDHLNQLRHQKNPIIDTQSTLDLLRSTTDAEEIERLRLKLKMLMGEVVESIWVKPEKYRGKTVAIIQINFPDGGHKHIFATNEFAGIRSVVVDGVSGGHVAGMSPIETLDLRSSKSEWWSISKYLRDADEELSPVPVKIPNDLKSAAAMWLTIKKNEVDAGSFRTIPAAIRRCVSAIGIDTQLIDLDKQRWGKWKRHLKKKVKDGRLSKSTARVNYNRSKELIRWLITENQITAWHGWDDSAKQVIG